ncbi:MAG: galactokinase [Chthoniobacterales bacterium]|nr:galactokinase [Chthoniobacterales bacterium]
MTELSGRETVCEIFANLFGVAPPIVVRAPGRVNLIGEHTDYNEGFVLPMAIDRATWIALRRRDDDTVRLHSLEQKEATEFSLTNLEKGPVSWSEYPKGVAWALCEEGYEISGWEGVSTCEVPMGAGLSSSASFELAVARAFVEVGAFAWDPKKMARLCQKAENEWVGVNCGIMDQMISAIGVEDHAVLIDCRDLSTEAVPLPAGAAVMVMDTGTRRGLVNSAYNERRRECEKAAQFFGVKALRDVSRDDLAAKGAGLDEVTRHRARHVVTENDRTQRAAAAMKAGQAELLGELFDQSHESMRDDFEISSAPLDAMVRLARESAGCLGARLTGGGFAGCALALVQDEAASSFIDEVSRRYAEATGLTPQLYLCRASNGAECLS